MKTSHKSVDGQIGSAIVTVLIVVTVAGTLVGTMALASSTRKINVERMANKIKATALAEAGVAQAYSVLITNWTARDSADAFPQMTYGGGVYDCTVVPVGSNVAVITCTGVYQGVAACVVADCRNYGPRDQLPEEDEDDPADTVDAYDYAVVSGGDGNWGGGGTISISNGTVHANGEFAMNGGGTVYGNVESSTLVTGNGTCDIYGDTDAPSYGGKFPAAVHGDVDVTNVPLVTIPAMDLTPYFNEALLDGALGVYTGNKLWTTPPVKPAHGIIWVNGDVKVTGSADWGNLTIIATGNIDWQGGSLTNFSTYPALVSRDGDISITANQTMQGLIFSQNGDVDKGGNGWLKGQIICGGEFTKVGGASAIYYMNMKPTPPGSSGDTGPGPDVIGISAWSK